MGSFSIFRDQPGVVALLSERSDGPMKVAGARANVAFGNRRSFFQRNGIDLSHVVDAGLVHGSRVAVVGMSDWGKRLPNTDTLLTKDSGTFLTVTVADCLPVFLYDPVHRVVGLVHAGWRGLVGGAIPEAIRRMAAEFGSNSGETVAAIGPGIGLCHFEVQDNFAAQFKSYPNTAVVRDGRTYLDLKQVARQQLVQVGLAEGSIQTSDLCTYCESGRYFSFRRDKPEEVEAMVAAVGLRG